MTEKYRVENLRCAGCADKIEEKIARLSFVEQASLNPVNRKLLVSFRGERPHGYMQKMQETARQVESQVVITSSFSLQGQNHDPLTVLRIIGSLLVLMTGLLTDFPGLFEPALYFAAYLLAGADILGAALRNLVRGTVFDENFLMSVATLGAFAIGEFPEGVAVMVFYKVGEWFQERAVSHSRRSIRQLMDIRPEYANVLSGDGLNWIRKNPGDVVPGDVFLVKPGEKIPLDGTVISGEAFVDTMKLTGEAVPRRFREGDTVLSGSLPVNGSLQVQAEKPYSESTVARILELVENAAAKKAPTEKFITRFSRVYTPVVVGLAALIMIMPPLVAGADLQSWVYSGLVFLVISCPCALVISIPLGFFGGIGNTSRFGVLVKGSNALEKLAASDTLVIDKTGTLTEGKFRVSSVKTYDSMDKDEVLRVAARLEAYSNHPIAEAICSASEDESGTVPFDRWEELAGRGLYASVNDEVFLVGNAALMEENGLRAPSGESKGTVVYVARNGKLLGAVIIEDEIRKEAAEAIEDLKKLGFRNVVMLTGDEKNAASLVAAELGIQDYYHGLLPGDKVSTLEKFIESGYRTVFVGDGINDAPVLARADLGIAMGAAGSDAAIEAADIAIMTDDLSGIPRAVAAARKTRKVVWENIVMALGFKFLVMGMGVLGLATLWMAVFADVGVALLAVANSLRVLRNRS